MNILELISQTPLPTILVVGGMLFIALAFGSQIGGKIEMPAERQKVSGIFGAILLLAGLAFYFLPANMPSLSGSESATGSQVAETSGASNTQLNSSNSIQSGTDSCFNTYFGNIPADRVATLETGTQDQIIISTSQSKSEPFALLFTNDRQVLGGLIVNFYLENALFKISSLVDQDCGNVTSYENASIGGDQNTLQNWNTLQMRLDDGIYLLDFDYSDGQIKGNLESLTE